MNILKHKIKNLINRHYTLSKHWQYRKYLRTKITGQTPLILFQMGKVGSTSMMKSLQTYSLPYDLFQVHVLTRDWINKVHMQYRRASRVHGRAIVDEHMMASMYLRDLLDRDFDRKEWKVISFVRDPIARNVSAFFQAFSIYFPDLAKSHQETSPALEQRVPELIKTFLEQFEEHDTPLHWFETHMQPTFGIDVYQTPFPKKQAYQIIQHDNISLLILRLEDLDNTAAPALSQFIGLDNFTLKHSNVALNKDYADDYRLFQHQLYLPETFIDHMYNSRYMRNFYTNEEIASFRKKWLKAAAT